MSLPKFLCVAFDKVGEMLKKEKENRDDLEDSKTPIRNALLKND